MSCVFLILTTPPAGPLKAIILSVSQHMKTRNEMRHVHLVKGGIHSVEAFSCFVQTCS